MKLKLNKYITVGVIILVVAVIIWLSQNIRENLDTTPAGCTIPTPQVGFDRYGNDIRTVENITDPQHCANLCCAETDCESYTHHNTGRCILKRGQATPRRVTPPRNDIRTGIVTKESGTATSDTYLLPNSTYTAGETWSDIRSYVAGNIVTLGGVTYKALLDNDGQDPATSINRLRYWRVFTPYTAGAAWSETTDYLTGHTATLNGVTYTAKVSNTNENPATSRAYWQGPPGTPDIGYTPGAEWSPTIYYVARNTATIGGVTYTARGDNYNQNPTTARDYWRVITPYTPGAEWSATVEYAPGNTGRIGRVNYTAIRDNYNENPATGTDKISYWRTPYFPGATWLATTDYGPLNIAKYEGMNYTAKLSNINQNPKTSTTYWRVSYADEVRDVAQWPELVELIDGVASGYVERPDGGGGGGGGDGGAAGEDAKKKKEEEETMLYIGIGVAAVLVVGVLAVSMSR